MSYEQTARAAIHEIHDPRLREALTELLDQGIDLRERLAEAVRLLKKVDWDEHSPTEIAAFLAKEKERG